MKRLLGSYLFTTTCSWIAAFVVPLAILSLTNSAVWTALTYAATMLPYLVVTPFAGVWSDRYSKRRFLIGGDIVSICLSVAIYLAMTRLTGGQAAMTLLFLAFASASVSAVHHPMFQSIAPEMMDEGALAKFNSLVYAFDNTTYIAAPALVAVMMGHFLASDIVLFCTVGFALSVPLLWFLPGLPVSRGRGAGVFAELAEGIRYVVRDRNLFSFSVLFACVNFGLSIIGANLIFIYTAIYGIKQDAVGYYYTIVGAGAVVGSLGAPWLMKRIGDANLIILCCLSAGIVALVAAGAPTAAVFAVEWALATGALSAVVVTFFTLRQRVVPATLLGRTVGVTRFISYAAIPPASILGGVIMDRFRSEAAVMGIGGAVIIAGSVLAMRAPAFQRR